MGRSENPVDRTVATRAKLAELLRKERARAALTYAEMAARAGVSAATLKRAASGTATPSQDTVQRFLTVCNSNQHVRTTAERLRLTARRDERGGRAQLMPSTVSAPHDLADALEALHRNAGAPSYREMQRRASAHLLPLASISRILNRKMLPVDEQQMAAFLTGCGMPSNTHAVWLDAWARATGRARPSIMDAMVDASIREWLQTLGEGPERGIRIRAMERLWERAEHLRGTAAAPRPSRILRAVAA
ncbi:helix-turn-helix domain-containing protein [Streptomyces sp. NPDC048350]|uniref:helix-turn-helix domain-containing protein n=1 Tax=Streptomyces sp. NPDC048350 TaxID=3365538 RepID=UPI0037132D69